MVNVAAMTTIFAASFAVGLGATLGCERIAARYGFVKQPHEDRWHRRPVPVLGGVAIMVATVSAVAWLGALRGRLLTLVVAALVMGALGLLDDVRPVRPVVKLVAQIALTGVLVQADLVLRLTKMPVVDIGLTLLWVVGITNAFNLLDNMDGLAAGMAAITAAFRLVFFLLENNAPAATITASFLGAVTGFLIRNLPPARIFMGDAGSLFLGFFLAGLCLVEEAGYYSRGVTAVLAVPVLLMAIPIFDTTFVTVTRFVTGQRVSQGGRDHTSHRLVALGGSEGRALVILFGISALGGTLALLTYRYGVGQSVVLVTLLGVGLALLGVYLAQVEVRRDRTARPAAAAARILQDFPYMRHAATVLVDLVLIVAAYYAAYLLRFENEFKAHRAIFLASVVPMTVCQLATMTLLGTYHGLWRYASLADMVRLVRGITAGTAVGIVYLAFTTRMEGLSRAVFVLDWVLLVLLIGASRVSFRLLGELLRGPHPGARRVLIYGAGDGGELALRELRNNPALEREVVGFIDDDRAKAGTRIHGVPVLGDLEHLEVVLADRQDQIEEVVIASGKISNARIRQLQATCNARGVGVARARVRFE
jgi:UDP-GlcNAc:undecaprenyl-phosphate/decaprenyl-phosphate GlcNAc-1-phosphate transferase